MTPSSRFHQFSPVFTSFHQGAKGISAGSQDIPRLGGKDPFIELATQTDHLEPAGSKMVEGMKDYEGILDDLQFREGFLNAK